MKYNSQAKRLMPLRERLISTCEQTPGGCWVWTASTTEHGYGRMSYKGQVRRAHRLAAHEWLGLDLDDPEIKVCHTCDNPPCINPEHLYLGTQSTNVRDMVERGRGYRGPSKWTHCAKGHELAHPNLVGIKNPRCRICHNAMQRAAYRRGKLRRNNQALDGDT